MNNNDSKIWLITGISGGLGKALAEEVMAKGDRVMGTFRKQNQVEDFNQQYANTGNCAFLADVTDKNAMANCISAIVKKFNKIDVLVNNAGYGLMGALEEISEEEARMQMETNFFAPLFITQSVLPIMRKQGNGHIIQISSIAGFQASPGIPLYNASKFALEGFSQSLALEVEELGIKVSMVEPGPFRTEFGGSSIKKAENVIVDYQNTAHQLINRIKSGSGLQEGDPKKAAKVIFEVVKSAKPPLHLPLGQIAIDRYLQKMKSIQFDIDNWQSISGQTSFNS